MENSFLNTNPEEGNNQISPEQKAEHLQFLSEIVAETGFVETFEMKELRSNPSEWVEKAQEIINTAEKDSQLRKALFVGYLMELVSICYEQGNVDEYFENIDYAAQVARSTGMIALAEKIESLG